MSQFFFDTKITNAGAVRLAPDLSRTLGGATTQTIVDIDGSSGYTTALSLTGKYIINWLVFDGFTASEQIDIKMTVDGVLIFDSSDPSTSTTDVSVYGDGNTSSSNIQQLEGGFIVESSFLLELQTSTTTDATLQYLARPIL